MVWVCRSLRNLDKTKYSSPSSLWKGASCKSLQMIKILACTKIWGAESVEQVLFCSDSGACFYYKHQDITGRPDSHCSVPDNHCPVAYILGWWLSYSWTNSSGLGAHWRVHWGCPAGVTASSEAHQRTITHWIWGRCLLPGENRMGYVCFCNNKLFVCLNATY